MTHFWAKTTRDGQPGISVFQHSINVGHVARCLVELYPSIMQAFNLSPDQVAVMAGLHDIGKVSPGFQRKCPAWLAQMDIIKLDQNCNWEGEMESDHGKVSHSAIHEFLLDVGFNRKSASIVSALLGAHHGRLNYPSNRGVYQPPRMTSENLSNIDWRKERQNLAQKIWESFLDSTNAEFSFSDNTSCVWWLAGLTSVADWIGSDEHFFCPEQNHTACKVSDVAQEAIEKIGFKPLMIRKDLSFQDIFTFPPNSIQVKAMEMITGPGVYVIEAPMGMGKTEAAFGAAYNLLADGLASGIFFALPTQATSNRMHLRLNQFLKVIAQDFSEGKLVHGNSWLFDTGNQLSPAKTSSDTHDRKDARAGRDWFASAKRSLLSPFGVGTVDQALLGVVATKHFFVRRYALAGKVVILDEIHSYDLYTGTLIDKLIEVLEGLGCTVIVLSATLTGNRRRQILGVQDFEAGRESGLSQVKTQPYPLISGRLRDEGIPPTSAPPPPAKSVKVDFISQKKANTKALEIAENGGSVLWICNTVEAAQKQYEILAEMVNTTTKLGLLHSRFPFWRRAELENVWMERFGKDGAGRCGSILIATQVVEQSVDLDADLMITDLAPTDMLLQRLGRLWRHPRANRKTEYPQLYIISENRTIDEFKSLPSDGVLKGLGSKAYVYDPLVLLRTLQVWQNLEEIVVPDQIRTVLEDTYNDEYEYPDSWMELMIESEGKVCAYRQKALMSSNIWNASLKDEEGIQTRINEVPTVSLVLCKSVSKKEVTFIDGASESFAGKDFRLSAAQAVHRNLVRVPKHCFLEQSVSDKLFFMYLYGDQCSGLVEPDGSVRVEGLKKKIQMYYSNKLGLVIRK